MVLGLPPRHRTSPGRTTCFNPLRGSDGPRTSTGEAWHSTAGVFQSPTGFGWSSDPSLQAAAIASSYQVSIPYGVRMVLGRPPRQAHARPGPGFNPLRGSDGPRTSRRPSRPCPSPPFQSPTGFGWSSDSPSLSRRTWSPAVSIPYGVRMVLGQLALVASRVGLMKGFNPLRGSDGPRTWSFRISHLFQDGFQSPTGFGWSSDTGACRGVGGHYPRFNPLRGSDGPRTTAADRALTTLCLRFNPLRGSDGPRTCAVVPVTPAVEPVSIPYGVRMVLGPHPRHITGEAVRSFNPLRGSDGPRTSILYQELASGELKVSIPYGVRMVLGHVPCRGCAGCRLVSIPYGVRMVLGLTGASLDRSAIYVFQSPTGFGWSSDRDGRRSPVQCAQGFNPLRGSDGPRTAGDQAGCQPGTARFNPLRGSDGPRTPWGGRNGPADMVFQSPTGFGWSSDVRQHDRIRRAVRVSIPYGVRMVLGQPFH